MNGYLLCINLLQIHDAYVPWLVSSEATYTLQACYHEKAHSHRGPKHKNLLNIMSDHIFVTIGTYHRYSFQADQITRLRY